MRIVSMLADAAQTDQQSRVHAIGINWNRMPSPTPGMAIVVLAEVPPEEAPAELSLMIELFDSAGAPVKVPSEGQLKQFKVSTVATAPARKPENMWETVRVPFVVKIGPGLSVPPGNYKFAIQVGRKGGHTLGDELRFCIVA